ncbi:uncharacterized protein LTR77_005413 [Saxophila tyrrhenica]|uniref:Uncharacterized protein n=1 Tax=Saxophila tyrrhenica TaxID=1690608 RepID=A0AAV9P8Z8_9PEZI|nr:hypothetical protein LTR77_005413 [Saxophila tyrrhenica]
MNAHGVPQQAPSRPDAFRNTAEASATSSAANASRLTPTCKIIDISVKFKQDHADVYVFVQVDAGTTVQDAFDAINRKLQGPLPRIRVKTLTFEAQEGYHSDCRKAVYHIEAGDAATWKVCVSMFVASADEINLLARLKVSEWEGQR